MDLLFDFTRRMISMDLTLIYAVIAGIVVLLGLILYFRVQAFISLLIASIVVGLLSGMEPGAVLQTVQEGMGSTLGFVATVVGLGAMFGAILEASGGATAIAQFLVSKMGDRGAPSAMVITGFVVAIPVFFDVAFIILVPVLYALQRRTGKSLLLFAIPLMAGLACTHAFIPPTPGPVAVADIIGVDLGWVILLGFIAGVPTALVGGLVFGRYISGKMMIQAPSLTESEETGTSLPHVGMLITIIAIPIFLILLNTLTTGGIWSLPGPIHATIALIGHPFGALIIANLLAWYLLGIRQGFEKDTLFDITTKSMMPAGTIILLTGAGGAFKQVLVDTGTGEMVAQAMSEMGIPLIVFAFLSAVFIRVIQGSATVAMITAAGLVSPLLANFELSDFKIACVVIAIASGSTILSHVNDSGFWLVSQYLGISEKQTFRSWTMMTTILAIVGFAMACLLFITGF